MRLKNGPPTDGTTPSNITQLRPNQRAPNPVGTITWADYFQTASQFVGPMGHGVTLDAEIPSQRAPMEAWRRFITSIGGGSSAKCRRITEALTCPGGRLSQESFPTRWPGEFTGDPNDNHGCTECR